MKLKIDRQADALYLTLSDTPAERTEEVAPGILMDYDSQGHSVGIEILHFSKRAPDADVQKLLFESIPMAG
ncbi:MAG: DUF2283 domain-containing protein [Candidatus Sumerlaeota bacterium]